MVPTMRPAEKRGILASWGRTFEAVVDINDKIQVHSRVEKEPAPPSFHIMLETNAVCPECTRRVENSR
jgi:hypothetical protein